MALGFYPERTNLQPISRPEGRVSVNIEMVTTGKRFPGDGPRIDDGSERAADDGRDETRAERLDRNTTEMVQELRVGRGGAGPVRIPAGRSIERRFELTTGFEHVVYYVTLVCIAIATALLIAPSIHHRVLFRQGEKPFLIGLGNRLMIAAMVFVAAGMAGIFVLISDFLFGGWAATIGGVLTATTVAGLWFGIPLWHRARDANRGRCNGRGGRVGSRCDRGESRRAREGKSPTRPTKWSIRPTESRFGCRDEHLAPSADSLGMRGKSSTVDASLLRTYVPRCKSHQGWFRSWRRAMGGWWPRAECLR